MGEEETTVAVQRYLNELGGDSTAESVVRALLDRAVRRLHLLCAADWSSANVRDQDGWIYHSLRREAEAMIPAGPPTKQ